jgi:hypothetical protein
MINSSAENLEAFENVNGGTVSTGAADGEIAGECADLVERSAND